MPHNDVPPNVTSYNSAISASERGGQWQLALGLLVGMRHNDLLKDFINCSSAISAGEKGGQWQHPLGLLVAMRHTDSLPNVISCSSGISADAKGGQWQHARNCPHVSVSSVRLENGSWNRLGEGPRARVRPVRQTNCGLELALKNLTHLPHGWCQDSKKWRSGKGPGATVRPVCQICCAKGICNA